ncbi:hypothetical protein ACFUGC_17320, partial [Gordonia sp. NPDC057248]
MCDNGAVSSQTRAGLGPDDLESLSAALAAGKRATVYLRDAMPSLNLEAGASARVVSIDGTTVTVSPRGVDDQLPFEADELRRNRPAAATTATAAVRRRTPEPAPPKPQPTSSSKTDVEGASRVDRRYDSDGEPEGRRRPVALRSRRTAT